MKKLKQENVTGIVLDLRRNGGGSLDEAINLTGLFIPSGPVVQTRRPKVASKSAAMTTARRSTMARYLS